MAPSSHPDTMLIAAYRWRQLSLEEREDFVPLAPDIAIELVSTTDRPAEIRVADYGAFGCRELRSSS